MKVLLIFIRIFGFIVSFVFLFLVVANIINAYVAPEELESNIWMNYSFFTIVFVASFAYFLAWRHEGLGGVILTICGVIISFLSDWKLGIPFFTVGQLFVFYWVLKKNEMKKQMLKK